MLNNDRPYNKMFAGPNSPPHLRVIGARAFVFQKRYSAKLGGRPGGVCLASYRLDNNTYSIYDPSMRRLMDSRKVFFIEALDVPLLEQDKRAITCLPAHRPVGRICIHSGGNE